MPTDSRCPTCCSPLGASFAIRSREMFIDSIDEPRHPIRYPTKIPTLLAGRREELPAPPCQIQEPFKLIASPTLPSPLVIGQGPSTFGLSTLRNVILLETLHSDASQTCRLLQLCYYAQRTRATKQRHTNIPTKAMDSQQSAPRATAPYLDSLVGRNVTIIGKVAQLRGELAVIDADGNINANLNRVCTSLREACFKGHADLFKWETNHVTPN